MLGGFFAHDLSWHWIFLINLPLGFAAYALSSRFLRRLKTPPRSATIDWWGALLILAAATPILLGVSDAVRAGGWAAPAAWRPIAAGLVFTLALVLRERVAIEPMLPLRLFANSVFTVSILITLLVQIVMMALLILVPLNYQLVAGLPPDRIGLMLVPLTVGSVVGSAGSGLAHLAHRALPHLPDRRQHRGGARLRRHRHRRARPFAHLRRDGDRHPRHRLGRAVLAPHHRRPERAALAGHGHRHLLPDVLPPDRRRLRRRDLQHAF